MRAPAASEYAGKSPPSGQQRSPDVSLGHSETGLKGTETNERTCSLEFFKGYAQRIFGTKIAIFIADE
jgi:hypothetical protein